MSGRIGRGTFVAWYLPTILLGVGLKFAKSPWDGMIALLYFVSIPVAILAGVRRSHDIGRSGWFALICFIPFAGWYLVFKEGTSGPNKYGSPPWDSRNGTVSPCHLQSLRARNIGQEVSPSAQSACGRRGLPSACSFGNWFGHKRLVVRSRGYESVGQPQQLAIDFCR